MFYPSLIIVLGKKKKTKHSRLVFSIFRLVVIIQLLCFSPMNAASSCHLYFSLSRDNFQVGDALP
jgi:hypothetical protein